MKNQSKSYANQLLENLKNEKYAHLLKITFGIYNNVTRFLLCAIDIFSKCPWVVSLKDKNGITITNTYFKLAVACGCFCRLNTKIACSKLLKFVLLIIMALSESALKKLHKDEIINLALDYQSKFDSTLAGIRNELSNLKKDFEQLRSDLLITKLVNTKLLTGVFRARQHT